MTNRICSVEKVKTLTFIIDIYYKFIYIIYMIHIYYKFLNAVLQQSH